MARNRNLEYLNSNKNWRDNCIRCPYYDECKSEKSADECKSFLDKIVMNNLRKLVNKLNRETKR